LIEAAFAETFTREGERREKSAHSDPAYTARPTLRPLAGPRKPDLA